MYIAIPIVHDIDIYNDNLEKIPTLVSTPRIIVKVDDAAYKHNPLAVIGAIKKRIIEDENNSNTSRFETSIPR